MLQLVGNGQIQAPLQTQKSNCLHLFIFLLTVCALSGACKASEVVLVDEVQYNFKSEGFLSPHTLQTIGRASFGDFENGSENARKVCLQNAKEQARQRLLRIMLHTYFEIHASENANLLDQDNFESDYPIRFSPGEYIQAELAFAALIKQSFIALQDARARTSCTIVLRLQGTDLPAQIRQQKLSFRPRSVPEPSTIRKNQQYQQFNQ